MVAPSPLPSGSIPSGSTSASDILTALKNLTLAINTLAQNYMNVQGLANTAQIPAGTLTVVKAAPGRLCQVSVLVAGSAPGAIYDGVSIADPKTKNVFEIPNTVGVFTANIPCAYGILVLCGAGQTVTVSWS